MYANENEQYSRRCNCNISIFALPELEDENCYEVVTEYCKPRLAITLSCVKYTGHIVWEDLSLANCELLLSNSALIKARLKS
jgi:hypothetical protein